MSADLGALESPSGHVAPAARHRAPARHGPWWLRRVGVHLGVIALFSLPAVFLWWKAWSGGATSTVRCTCLDPGQQVWFIAWPAYALSHGLNPFFTTWLWPMDGANLLNNASAPLAGLVISPFTWVFGSVAATTFALTLAPGLSAWGCWVACRRFVTWRPACWVAGFLFGYSPFVVQSVAQGHLSTGLLVFPPLILVVLHETLIRQRWSPARCGVSLGLLVLAQFLISAEMLSITAVIAVVGIVAAAVLAPHRVVPQFPFAIRAFGIAALVTVVLMAAPLWFMLHGPQRITGSIWSGEQGLFVDQIYQLWSAGNYRGALWSSSLAGPPTAYVGFGVLIAAAVSVVVAWRRRAMWVMTIIVVVSTVLSWGGLFSLSSQHLYIFRWLPGSWLNDFPVLENISVFHIAAFTDLGLALVIGIGLDALWSSKPWRRVPAVARIVALAGAVVAMVVPVWLTYQAPLAVQSTGLPPWYTTAGRQVPEGSVVTTYPFPASAALTSEPMVWQSVEGMRFRLAGGYIKVPGSGDGVIGLGPPGSATRTLDNLTLGAGAANKSKPVTAYQLDQLRSTLTRWGTSYVVVTNRGAAPVAAAGLFTAATGRAPQISHRAWVWDLRRQPLRGQYDAASAAAAFTTCRNATAELTPVPPGRPLPQALNACVAAGTNT